MERTRTLFMLILAFLFANAFTQAQTCSIPTLNTQAAVDAFPSNFPNCTQISNVLITGSNITNLDSLYQITSVVGYVWIVNAPNITSLSGLHHLTSTGELRVQTCHGLVNLEGLSGLETVENLLRIEYNDQLVSLQGLDNLTNVNGTVRVISNDNLLDLSGLEGLSSVLGNLEITSNTLQSLAGLDNVQQVQGDLILSGASSELNVLSGMDQLTHVGGVLEIKYMNSVLNISAFPMLQEVQGLRFESLGLKGLTGMQNLTKIHGNLEWVNLNSLIAFNGLNALDSIGANMYVATSSLLQITGFSSLKTIGGALTLLNTKIPNLHWMQSIEELGTLTLISNSNLQSLDGLSVPTLHTLSLQGNSNLASIQAASSITSVEHEILLANTVLQSLQGLENLQTAPSEIRISNNGVLTDISALDGLELLGTLTFLRLHSNAQLAVCDYENICTYIQTPGTSFDIFGNETGCKNPAELVFSCNEAPCYPDGLLLSSQSQIDAFPANHPWCIHLISDLTIEESIPGDITHLDSLYTLQSVGGNLNILNNTALSELSGLQNLEFVAGTLELNGNGNLQDISALDGLSPDSIQSVAILNNAGFSACNSSFVCEYRSLPGSVIELDNNATGCNSVQELDVACGPDMTCLPGGITFNTQAQVNAFAINYPDCSHILGDLIIEGLQGQITDMSPFQQIKQIDGNLRIRFTDVSDLSGFANLESVGGNLGVLGNNTLINLEGFESLTQVGGNLTLSTNTNLESLQGIGNLQSVGGDLTIEYHHKLASLEGFDNSISVSGGFLFVGNIILVDLSWFADQDLSSTPLLAIGNNLQLEDCHLENVCNFASDPDNNATIWNNAPGCKSREEVVYVCYSVPCLTGGITLTTQQEIDDFASNYPGCNQLFGDLIIQEATPGNITNLDSLQTLNEIHGTLSIAGNSALQNLDGLRNVFLLNGDLHITQNTNLNSLVGLDTLQPEYLTSVTIEDNANLSLCAIISMCAYFALPDAIVSVAGNATGCDTVEEVGLGCGELLCDLTDLVFNTQQQINNFPTLHPWCTEISGDLIIQSNLVGSIQNLNGLAQLKVIGGSLEIRSNANLISTQGLHGIESIGNNLYVGGNSKLLDIEALLMVTSIPGELIIENNAVLASLVGLNQVADVQGGCSIINNQSILDLQGLEALSQIGGQLTIQGNNSLQSLIGLESIQVLPADLLIEDNASLTHLQGLNNLNAVASEIRVKDNASLPDLQGLEALSQIGGRLAIQGNNSLQSLIGLENLHTIGQELRLENNTTLQDLTGLGGLQSLGTSLILNGNSALESLQGLDQLNQINGALTIFNNAQLSNLQDLSNLTSIGGTLSIGQNALLESLEGLHNIDEESISNLTLLNNELLSECSIENICRYLQSSFNFSNISGNAEGCSSRTEIRNLCPLVSTQELYSDGLNPIAFFPNPSSGKVQILTSETGVLHITDNLGNILRKYALSNAELDLSDLPDGLYLLSCQTPTQRSIHKLIISKR